MNVIPSAGESTAPAVRPSATIDIRIQRIEQLFDSQEPSPFHGNEKALRRDAESYIVELAGEHGRAASLRHIVHAPISIKPHAAELTRAIHAHFERAHAQCRRRYQWRMRIGRTLLIAGTAVLGIALLLRIYKIYAESFRGAGHLGRILAEAQTIVSDALAASPQQPEIASRTNLKERP